MEKRVDIIVLGATGFTGKYVVKKLASLIKEPEYSDLTWGIAGRSQEKLDQLLREIQQTGVDTVKIPCIKCDIKHEDTIMKASGQARVLMNATGPNILLSEPVVKACIATKTHYVDISAEFYQFLRIYQTYNKSAENSEVLIVPACGFATIPVISGLMHLENNFSGTLYSVETYLELGIPKRAYIPGCNKCLVHYGTFESLVLELFNRRKMKISKSQLFPDLHSLDDDVKRSFFHRSDGKLWFPYPFLDQDVVEVTQTQLRDTNGKKPYHFKMYTTMPLLIHFFIILPVFFLAFYVLCYFKCFQRLVLRYPRFFSLGYFSHKGPTEKMMNEMSYSHTLKGKGWDDADTNSAPKKTLTVKVFGTDPGYKTTAAAFVFSAITILREHSKMPRGGVLATGAVFQGTEIVTRLSQHGFKYEIINN